MAADVLVAEAGQPFESLLELRAQHVELMRAVRRESRDEKLIGRVRGFMRRAEATGARIDAPGDRDAAQGILDYWTAWLLTAADRTALSAVPPVLADFDPSNAADLSQAENPYRGLSAFTEEDAGRFIGQEEAVKNLLTKLREQPVVLVIGPLGSGKTSLVLAGAVPRLKSRLIIEGKNPMVAVMLPGTDPFAALLRSLHQAAADPALPELGVWIAEQKKTLEQSPARLRTLVETAFPERPLILVVDQFEEVFTQCPDPKVREQFTQAVVGIAPKAEDSNRVVLVIREDYRQQALQLEALKPLAENPEARFSPSPLTAQEARRIIEGLAATVGLKFDEGLVEDIAKEVAGDVGALPTLQFTLSKLWSERERDRVTWDSYRRVGRPREALKRAADAVFDALSPEQKKTAERIFLELVRPTTGEDFVRRRMRREALLRVDSPENVTDVLERYVEAALIRKVPGTDADDDRFEVAHEALVNYWPRLREWMRREREQSEKKLQLITTARLWQESGRKSGYLLMGEALEEAAPYRDASPELRDLIAASQQKQRRTLVALTVLPAAVALIVAGVISLLWLRAERSAAEAQRSAAEAKQSAEQVRNAKASVDLALEDARAAARQQQLRIDELETRLRRVAGPAATETSDTETVPREVAQVFIGKGISDRTSPAAPQTGYIWIGSDPQTNLQEVESGTPVLPQAVRPNGRYRVNRSVVLRSDKPSDTYIQAPSVGVVPAGTVITATGPAISYTRPATDQYWLPVRVDPSDQPIAYIRFTTASRPDAVDFADQIQARGYRIPLVDSADLAKGLNEVRYYFPADRKAAEKLAADTAATLQSLGYRMPSRTKVVDLSAKASPRNVPGVLELWVDLPNTR